MSGSCRAASPSRARQGRGRIRPPLLVGHLGLAVAGLIAWIVYHPTGRDALAWAALGALGLVALLGATMLVIWLGQGRDPAAARAAGRRSAESHFPPALVAGHGLLAVITVALVALAAAGVADWTAARIRGVRSM